MLTEGRQLHKGYGLEVKITYFHIPHESYAALARHVEIVNRSGETLALEILDGLPEILPSGIENAEYKNMGHLLRSWMQARLRNSGTGRFCCPKKSSGS